MAVGPNIEQSRGEEKMMNPTREEKTPHLTEYYYILSKHKSLVITSFVVIVCLTMLFTFLMKPLYRASATLAIEKEQTISPLTGERVDYESYLSQSLTFNTHFKLITSRPVMEKVIQKLELEKLDKVRGLGVSPLKELYSHFRKNVFLLLGYEEKVLSREEKLEALIEKLREKIDIEEVRDTRLVKLNVADYDQVVARDIANALARTYIEFNMANRLKYSQNTLSWMSDQLYEMKKKLEDSEREFLAYKQSEKLFSMEGKHKVIAQKIAEFNDAYLETRNRRLELDAKLKELKGSSQSQVSIPHVRSLIDNPLIDDLYSELLKSEVELSRLSKVYKSKHPKVVQIRTKIDNTRKKLNEEIKKELESLKAERSVLRAREGVLQNTISQFENEALETTKKAARYTILQRNVETNQRLYDTLLSKAKETNITSNIDISNLRITEEAVLPEKPIKPKKRLNLILAIIFGLMTGIGLAFLWQYLDRSLHTDEDVERFAKRVGKIWRRREV